MDKMKFRVLAGWRPKESINAFNTFMDEVIAREGFRRAKELNDIIESSLRKRLVGRVIVRAVAKKYMRIAGLLSKIVRLELRTYNDAAGMAAKYEFLFRGSVVRGIDISDYERI